LTENSRITVKLTGTPKKPLIFMIWYAA